VALVSLFMSEAFTTLGIPLVDKDAVGKGEGGKEGGREGGRRAKKDDALGLGNTIQA